MLVTSIDSGLALRDKSQRTVSANCLHQLENSHFSVACGTMEKSNRAFDAGTTGLYAVRRYHFVLTDRLSGRTTGGGWVIAHSTESAHQHATCFLAGCRDVSIILSQGMAT